MLSVDEPITLITKDGDRITTTAKFKNLCSLVANILQDSDQSEEIPLTQIPTAHLNRILEYSEHHNFIAPEPVEKPLKTGKLDQIISDPWDIDFLRSFTDDGLVEFIFSLNFLDIRCMLDICFAFIAAKFRGRQIDDIRAEYNIEEEFTRLEEEKIKRENPWTEDESVDRLTLK